MNTQKGFSLIEVLVSLVIIMTVSTGVFHSLLSNLKHTRDTFYRTQAMHAAHEHLDILRMQDPVTIPGSGSTTSTIEIGNRTFNIVATFCKNANFCSLNTKHIALEVFYRGESRFSVETVYTKLR
jgi:prepilin-type N-terminal cleavage/methylation domain-containing protein